MSKVVRNSAVNTTTKEKGDVKMLKFNLLKGEVIRKIKYTNQEAMFAKHALYSYLKVLDYEKLLPKGYLTRVNNKNIGIEAAYRMAKRLELSSQYRISITHNNGYYFIALVEKPKLQPVNEFTSDEESFDPVVEEEQHREFCHCGRDVTDSLFYQNVGECEICHFIVDSELKEMGK